VTLAATICPTVLAQDPHTYREQMERVEPFASRIHIDLADGIFAPVKTVGLDQIWWSGDRLANLHVMYRYPFHYIRALFALRPSMIIVHAEAEGRFLDFATLAHRYGIEVGVALMQMTPVASIAPALEVIDHALIFSGDLGHFDGETNLALLDKVKQLRQLKPQLEIGWDGGINDQNAATLIQSGVDVLNVGGYIQQSSDPEAAYGGLKNIVQQTAA
jgi:ribulose-phosphate 3-epimerase